MARQVTACITCYRRPAALARLVKSVEAAWPGLSILVQQTGGNLSWARNQLARACPTPLMLVLEEDFEFTAETRLDLLLRIMLADPELGVVGGYVVEGRRRRAWTHRFDAFRGRADMLRSNGPWRGGANWPYQLCDAVLNFGLWRRGTALETPWDEELPLNEHCDWFWRLKQTQRWRVAYCPRVGCLHHRERPAGYAKMRQRDFRAEVRRKTGLSFSLREDRVEPGGRPNVVVLGVGHSNTTITTRQLAALGWSLGDADEDFAESVAVRELNRHAIKSGRLDERAAAAAIAALGEAADGWAVKDPRFVQTLHQWHAALAPHEPLLLWVTKDSERVATSYTKHGLTIERARSLVAERLDLAAHQFERWPGQKLRIDAGQIAAAARLFDAARSGHAPATEA